MLKVGTERLTSDLSVRLNANPLNRSQGPEKGRQTSEVEMTHFGSDVEHAVYILLELAAAPPKAQISALEFADTLRLPVGRIHKLLASLERACLVSRIRALDGGWRLGDPPKRVSILAVIEAVQDYRPLFEGADTDAYSVLLHARPAARRGFFGLHAIMLEAEREMLDTLARRTLEDIKN